MKIIKTLKKDCKNKEHTNVGVRLTTKEKICLDCAERLED